MLLLLEQAARHSLLQGQEDIVAQICIDTQLFAPSLPLKVPGPEDPRAEARLVSVKQLVMRVTQVNDELQTLRNDSLTG